MRGSRPLLLRLARVLAGAAWLPAGTAQGLDVSGRIEPGFATSTSSTTDAAGRTTTTDATTWTQRYSLDLQGRPFPLLKVMGYGLYESAVSMASTDGVPSESEAWRWTATGRASLGDPTLNASLGYDRNVRSEDSLVGGSASLGTDLVRDAWSLFGTWRPEGLPWLGLRLTRTNFHDAPREVTDQTTDEAYASASYQARGLDLRYRFFYQNPVDHLRGTDTTNLSNGARVSYGGRFLRDRVSVYGSYELVLRSSETRVAGTGGTVSTQQFPVAGLSAIETDPAPLLGAPLGPNGVVADGDTAAGAGLNVGFGPSLSGDAAYRSVGAQLADAITPVNALWLWVDRALPAEIVAAFVALAGTPRNFTVYRSDDNRIWTPVGGAGPVAFAPFQNRFEIPIAETRARYFKVVLKPLPAAATTDVRYRDILVTELQLFQVVPASQARGRTSRRRGDASLSARVRILESVPLSYDFNATLSHDSARSGVLYSYANGLSLSTPLAATLSLDARVERSDSDAGQGKEALNRASASLGAQPLPKLGGNLTYTGQLQESAAGRQTTHSLGLFARGDPYRGVSASASGTLSLVSTPDGATGRQAGAQAGAGLTPNRWLALSASFGWTSTRFTGTRAQRDVQTRLEGNATLNPVPAIAASAGIARVVQNGTPSTLANLAASVSPFPGGDLFLGFSYNQTLDTRIELRTRTWGPALRWRLRSAAYLDVAYSVVDSTSPAIDLHTEVLSARLSLGLP